MVKLIYSFAAMSLALSSYAFAGDSGPASTTPSSRKKAYENGLPLL